MCTQVSKGLSRVEETLLKMYDDDEAERKLLALQAAARTHGLLEALAGDDDDSDTEAAAASPHLAEVAEPHTAEEVSVRPSVACGCRWRRVRVALDAAVPRWKKSRLAHIPPTEPAGRVNPV